MGRHSDSQSATIPVQSGTRLGWDSFKDLKARSAFYHAPERRSTRPAAAPVSSPTRASGTILRTPTLPGRDGFCALRSPPDLGAAGCSAFSVCPVDESAIPPRCKSIMESYRTTCPLRRHNDPTMCDTTKFLCVRTATRRRKSGDVAHRRHLRPACGTSALDQEQRNAPGFLPQQARGKTHLVRARSELSDAHERVGIAKRLTCGGSVCVRRLSQISNTHC